MFHNASNIWSFSQFFFHHRFLQCVILLTACFILSVIFLAAILWIGFQTVLCTYFSEQILLGRLTQTLISKNSPKAAVRTVSSHVALNTGAKHIETLRNWKPSADLEKDRNPAWLHLQCRICKEHFNPTSLVVFSWQLHGRNSSHFTD